MSAADVSWAVGRPTLGTLRRVVSRLKVYGKERVPLEGGIVVACNHFSLARPARARRRGPGSSTTWRRSRRTAFRGSAR